MVRVASRCRRRSGDLLLPVGVGFFLPAGVGPAPEVAAAAHLAEAWRCAYALHPDPVKAYGEAIKAVEAAAHAVLEPNNRNATLGTMRRRLRDTRDRYALAIEGPDGRGDVSPLLECMSLLWEGQTSRHGQARPRGRRPCRRQRWPCTWR
jgi:hypothetical protein